MADDKIILSVEIDGIDKEIKSLKDLKDARRQLQTEFINGNEDAAKSIGVLDKKLEDLTKSTNTFKSSGVENLNSSFGVLKDGFEHFDVEKIKAGFKGLGAAMAAIPILLIVQGITYLVENFDNLSKGSGILAKSLRFVGDILGGLKDLALEFTDAIGLTNTALDKQGEEIKKNADIAKEALSAQTAEYDRQIAVSKAAGQNTLAFEKAKQQAIVDTNLRIAQQIEALVRAGGEFDNEQKKLLSASLENIKSAKVQERVVVLNDQKQKQDDYKKHLDELKKIDEESKKNIDDAVKSVEDARIDKAIKENEDLQKRSDDRKAQAQKDADEQLKLEDEASSSLFKINKDRIEKTNDLEKNSQTAKIQITEQGFQAAQALSDAFFQNQISAAGGNQGKLTDLAKHQFQINKALQIAQATITGTQAALNAYTSTLAIPVVGPELAPIAAGVAGIIAAANIAKIAAQQFNPGTSSAPSAGSSFGSIGSAPSAPPPPQAPSAQNTPFTSLQPATRAYVVETDITNSQASIDKIQRQSKF